MVGAPGAEVLRPHDSAVVAVVLIVEPRSEEPLEAEDAILGRDRLSVVEPGVLPELEGIGLAVGRDLPELRQRRDGVEMLVEADETVVELLDEHHVDGEDRLGRVEVRIESSKG